MALKSIFTPAGEIVGITTEYGFLFRGVPYAKAERFCMPMEITHYEQPVIATEQGVCCPQMRAYWNEEHRFYYQEFRKGDSFTYDENCQILNIYSPEDAENCPVLVFIHGGSFTGGSINERHFDGSAYARKGVIYVAINYRLNVFGFFADGIHCKGNLGLYDQYTAIQWIKHNISAFGGNPDKITLIGQSAGAMSIHTLISSPLTKGMIQGAIMLSGCGKRRLILPLTRPNTFYWKKLIRKSGAKSFEDFCKMSAEQIWNAWKTADVIGKALWTKPVIDGSLVVNNKNDIDIPTIVGTVKKDLANTVMKRMALCFAKKQKRRNVPCYLFTFDRLLPNDGASFHACDLWYLLGSLERSFRPMEKHDFELSEELVTRVVAFTKDCNVNTNRYTDWNIYKENKDKKSFE